MDAIEWADAWTFTSRAQDLEELIQFWRETKRIGDRLDLMQASIDRRLIERDPDRADVRPLRMDKPLIIQLSKATNAQQINNNLVYIG